MTGTLNKGERLKRGRFEPQNAACKTKWDHDKLRIHPVSHLQSILHKLGVNTLDGATYGYDLAGNRTSKTNQLNSTVSNYGYDNIYQLTGVTQGATKE